MAKTPAKPAKNRRRKVSQPEVAAPRRSFVRRVRDHFTRVFGGAAQGLRSRLFAMQNVLRWVLRGFALCAMLVMFVAAGRLLENHVRTAEAFETHVIEVDGNERMASEDVLLAAGLSLGQNIFDVSPEEAEQRLRDEPWIADAEVERRLPDTYRISLSEREPVALLALDTLYLISGDGGIFKALEEGDPMDFPVVTGVDSDLFSTDRNYRTRTLVHVVSLLHDYRDAGLFRREPIAEIHINAAENYSVYVGVDTTHVRLGQAPFRRKLRRFRKVLDRLRSKKARAAYVYLDNVRRPDRVTVRLR